MTNTHPNPYAAPGAFVADRDPAAAHVQPVRLWSARGRIGRLRYLAHMFASYILFMLVAMAAGAVMGFAGSTEGIVVVTWVLAVPYFVFTVLKSIQRSHDMDWSGWWTLVALIPLVGLVWIFKAGTPGPNRFGAPPPPNTLGVRILGLAIPVVAVVGILAAVALPAYQAYNQRAQAAQTGR